MILMLLTQLYQLFFDDLDTHPIIMPVLTRSQTKQLSFSTNNSSMNVASVTSPIDTTNDICLPCSTTSSQHCDLSCLSLLSSSCTPLSSHLRSLPIVILIMVPFHPPPFQNLKFRNHPMTIFKLLGFQIVVQRL